MRKTHKIINIALIFTLIGVFLCQDLAYSLDIYHLRLPMDIDEERFFSAAEKKKNFSIPIRWTTTRLDYNNMKTEMPYFMKEYIREVVLNTDNGFLEKTIFSCLKKKIKPEEVKKIKGMGIKLFQLGKYNYIFRVNVSLGTKKVTFGLVAAKGSSLNQSTMDDFANILSLRKQFPKFSDLLQNPYVLDNSTSLTMFSCEWFNDYYELGIDWNNAEQTTTFYINDKRIPPRKIREERIDPYMFQFTKEETAAIVEETSRTLTIFFDEERQRSIDLSRIIIEAGDLTHYRKVSKPKLKLMTVRNIKKNQNANDFITALMNLDNPVGGVDLLMDYGGHSLDFSYYRKSVAKGILRGLQDKHGKKEGEERFSVWCKNCPLLESAAISLTNMEQVTLEPMRESPVSKETLMELLDGSLTTEIFASHEKFRGYIFVKANGKKVSVKVDKGQGCNVIFPNIRKALEGYPARQEFLWFRGTDPEGYLVHLIMPATVKTLFFRLLPQEFSRKCL
ncbi:MAG: hypothetical protein P9L93_02980 [Candidatus Gorgyraea atricola]|nr:hypothetical protein [Candidatus Gorgyraea atricola]